MDQEWPQTGLDLHPGGFPALIFITRHRECPGVAIRCASSLEGRQPPQACGLLPHRLDVFAVDTEGLILIWVSWVSPHVQGGSRSPGPRAGEPARVRGVRGAPAPRAGAAAALPGLSHVGRSRRSRNGPGTLQMSCEKPGQPQLCHLQRLRGRRWCGGEMQPGAPRELCLPLPPPAPRYLCRRAKYPCCAEAAIFL